MAVRDAGIYNAAGPAALVEGQAAPFAFDASGNLKIAPPAGTVAQWRANINTSFTRPNDGNVYAAGDTVANATAGATILTFASIARAIGTGGIINKARLLTSQVANVSRHRLHLFNTAPTMKNDNALCDIPLYADDGKYIGYIDFPAPQAVTAGSPTAAFAQNDTVRLEFLTVAVRDIYGILETIDIYTPAAQQTYSITLGAAE